MPYKISSAPLVLWGLGRNQRSYLARDLGLISCFKAAYSPQSNGMSEAFVGTLKRDYVYTNDCFDADTVFEMLSEWFRDYNGEAPHSGLGMMSPVEYKKQIKQGAQSIGRQSRFLISDFLHAQSIR